MDEFQCTDYYKTTGSWWAAVAERYNQQDRRQLGLDYQYKGVY